MDIYHLIALLMLPALFAKTLDVKQLKIGFVNLLPHSGYKTHTYTGGLFSNPPQKRNHWKFAQELMQAMLWKMLYQMRFLF